MEASSLLELLSSDLQLQILGCAGPRAAAVYGGCSRAAQRLVTENDAAIFRPPTVARTFVSTPVPGSVSPDENAGVAEALKACLKLESWRDVWETTTRIMPLPCLGFFNTVPMEPVESLDDLRGAFCHVTLDPEAHALCIEVFTHEVSMTMSWPCVKKEGGGALALAYSNNSLADTEYVLTAAAAGAASQGPPDAPVFRLHDARGIHITAAMGLPPRMLSHYRPLASPILPASALPSDPVLLQLQGLWMGVYGPHGREVLHVRFVELADEGEDGEGREGASRGRVVCEGLKLTGDPNVPAGKWSFRIDLGRPQDLDAALAADPRPIYASGENPLSHVLLDLEGARAAGVLQGLYPGQGQINRVPGTWEPETVEVDLVVFRGERDLDSISRFGIVWRDEDHPLRHCIGFKRFHPGTGEALIYNQS